VNSGAVLSGGDDPWFSLVSDGQTSLVVSGDSGVSASRGLYHYLKNVLGGSVTWGEKGSGNKVPPFALAAVNETHASAYQVTYAWNVCTFGYSSSFWNWSRFEVEIDWLALHGYNTPLAFVGREAIIRQLYAEVGLTEDEVQAFLSGPAFLPWQRMGNLRKWAGPLSEAFANASVTLQKRILGRMRDLGMQPVLPGFAGFVPDAITRVFPDANVTASANWWRAPADLCCVTILEPTSPLYATLGAKYYALLEQTFGRAAYYSCDTYNEMNPPTDDPSYLAAASSAVFSAIRSHDPAAVWLMQGWLFYSSASFWQPAQVQAYLGAVPDDGMLILDLFAETSPVWTRTNSFYGKPFVWCMLHNFGGRRALFGNLTHVASAPATARARGASTMVGVGFTPEAIGTNPVMYEVLSDLAWQADGAPVPLTPWLGNYSAHRYSLSGAAADVFASVWSTNMVPAAYSYAYDPDKPISNVPDLHTAVTRNTATNPALLTASFRAMVAALDGNESLVAHDGPLSYDLVDFGRQVLVNVFDSLHSLYVGHFQRIQEDPANPSAADVAALAPLSNTMLHLLQDLDTLLGTDINYLLGVWLARADDLAADGWSPRAQLRFNALNQITLWGPTGEINDYAQKQWHGLVADYYAGRWTRAFAAANASIAARQAYDPESVAADLITFGQTFDKSDKAYTTQPSGGVLAACAKVIDRYTVAAPTGTFAAKGNTTVAAVPIADALTTDPAQLSALCALDPSCACYTSTGFIFDDCSHTLESDTITLFVRQ
jgi:alpha-N-acetylglucosaminidase